MDHHLFPMALALSIFILNPQDEVGSDSLHATQQLNCQL